MYLFRRALSTPVFPGILSLDALRAIHTTDNLTLGDEDSLFIPQPDGSVAVNDGTRWNFEMAGPAVSVHHLPNVDHSVCFTCKPGGEAWTYEETWEDCEEDGIVTRVTRYQDSSDKSARFHWQRFVRHTSLRRAAEFACNSSKRVRRLSEANPFIEAAFQHELDMMNRRLSVLPQEILGELHPPLDDAFDEELLEHRASVHDQENITEIVLESLVLTYGSDDRCTIEWNLTKPLDELPEVMDILKFALVCEPEETKGIKDLRSFMDGFQEAPASFTCAYEGFDGLWIWDTRVLIQSCQAYAHLIGELIKPMRIVCMLPPKADQGYDLAG